MAGETNIWAQLSESLVTRVKAVEGSVVAVHGGGRGTASGVVWRPGTIVTVHRGMPRHGELLVIHGGERKEAYKAKLMGSDAGTDLAVLRVEDGDLPAAPLAAEDTGRMGELVLAVGRSRLGDVSASLGIVARTGSAFRSWRGGQIDRLIRPDVRLYVGQQGSALVNERGQVLGINSGGLARAAVITVPAQTVNRVIDAIREHGHVPRPYLGIAMQAVPVPEAARAQFAPGAEYALLVTHVEAKGAAAQGGLLVGDLLVSLNEQPIQSMRDMLLRLHALRVGELARLKVVRGGAVLEVQVNVADRA